VAPAAYSTPAPSKARPSTATAAPTAPQDSVSSRIQEWISLLNTSTYPELREYAAANLAAFDWRANPQIVEALLGSARKDATAAVRVASIRSLAKMNANSQAVQQTLRELNGDVNATIRDAAHLALGSLKTGPTN
jgi:hypothetical protein